MFRVDTDIINKDDKEILYYTREVQTEEAVFIANVGTTGNKTYGDTKRNVLSYFSIENLYPDNGVLTINTTNATTKRNIDIFVKGESEIRGIIKVLKFIIKVLEEELNHVDD